MRSWRRLAYPWRPDSRFTNAGVSNGEPSSPRCYTRKRGDASQERRVALDELEELLRGDAEQSCVRLVLRHLDAKDRSPIHPAKGLEIAPVIEDRYVLANAKVSGFCHHRIHHFLGSPAASIFLVRNGG
jgi:hypothetical protein